MLTVALRAVRRSIYDGVDNLAPGTELDGHENVHRCKTIAANAASFPIIRWEINTSLPENPVYSVVVHLCSNWPNLCHLIFYLWSSLMSLFRKNKLEFASDLFLFLHHCRNHDLFLIKKTFSCSPESSTIAQMRQQSCLVIVLLCHCALHFCACRREDYRTVQTNN